MIGPDVHALKRNEAAAVELKKILSMLNGIATVDINPITGSLLVNYNPKELRYQEIVRLLERKGYFEPSKALTNDEYVRNALSKGGQIVRMPRGIQLCLPRSAAVCSLPQRP